MMVEQTLCQLGIHYQQVALGYIKLSEQLSTSNQKLLFPALQKLGFDIIEDQKTKVVEKTKVLLIDLIQNRDNEIKIKYSQYLSDNLQLDYGYISSLFSASEHITIERFIIQTKINKVKNYLKENELSLKEIAAKLGYSSVQALSNQFHKETGISPTEFRAGIILPWRTP